MERLRAHFDPRAIKCKPIVVSGTRALAMFYVDARSIMQRLDDVVGIENWCDQYRVVAGGVVCQLSLRINGEWIEKQDVGGLSDQDDEGDKLKAAFSDALKRAAVKWGVGRYLYRVKPTWCDYDPQKKQFVKMPTIPKTHSIQKVETNHVHKRDLHEGNPDR
jgi:hypothetical protein